MDQSVATTQLCLSSRKPAANNREENGAAEPIMKMVNGLIAVLG